VVLQTLADVRPGVVALTAPVRLDDADVLAVVLALRDRLENAQRVQWTAATDIPAHLAELLEHLPPPSSGGGEGGDRWRERHRYGALFYRLGPGFVSVRERRTQRDAAVFTLTGQGLDCWEELKTPSSHICGACAVLDDEGLVLTRHGERLLLPFRLRYPPTPFLAI
jgi:hypothetical protein